MVVAVVVDYYVVVFCSRPKISSISLFLMSVMAVMFGRVSDYFTPLVVGYSFRKYRALEWYFIDIKPILTAF